MRHTVQIGHWFWSEPESSQNKTSRSKRKFEATKMKSWKFGAGAVTAATIWTRHLWKLLFCFFSFFYEFHFFSGKIWNISPRSFSLARSIAIEKWKPKQLLISLSFEHNHRFQWTTTTTIDSYKGVTNNSLWKCLFHREESTTDRPLHNPSI